MGNYFSTELASTGTTSDATTQPIDPSKLSRHIKALRVCMGDRAVTYLDVFRTDAIESLEEKIARSFNLDIDTFCLQIGEKVLVRKDATLQDYGYVNGDINVCLLTE